MFNSRLTKAFQDLKEISKFFILKHKEMFLILRNLEPKQKPSPHSNNIQKPVLIDFPTFESLQKTCTQLIDQDEKSCSTLLILKDCSSKFESLQKAIQVLSFQQESSKKIIFQDFKNFHKSFSDLSKKLNQHLQLKTVSLDSMQVKIKSVLSPLVYPETIDLYSFQQEMEVPVRLIKTYYQDLPTEEPEVELNSKNESKKLESRINFLTKSLERVVESLLNVLLDFAITQKSIEDTRFTQSITTSDLKELMMKISKLHNRGSLTDEEARNMLGKISEIPISPCNEVPEMHFLDSDRHLETFSEDTKIPIMDNKKSPMTQSFTKGFQKRLTPFRKLSKRVQTPTKVLRNTSLPKASALIKFNAIDKSKQLKFKSKSPHSFMYI